MHPSSSIQSEANGDPSKSIIAGLCTGKLAIVRQFCINCGLSGRTTSKLTANRVSHDLGNKECPLCWPLRKHPRTSRDGDIAHQSRPTEHLLIPAAQTPRVLPLLPCHCQTQNFAWEVSASTSTSASPWYQHQHQHDYLDTLSLLSSSLSSSMRPPLLLRL